MDCVLTCASLLSASPRGERGEVSLWGHLVFDEPIAAPRRLELVPYAAARSENVPEHPANGGFSAGLDVRAGLGTAATLSATFNPDFGQVEQDPAVPDAAYKQLNYLVKAG